MELRTIHTFIKVAGTQNFSKAAEQLGYSQSAVTIQIQQLERELGTPLFERIGKKVSLTEQGQAFISYANEIMKAADRARNFSKNAGTPEGTLRIGTVESIGTALLPDLLLRYYQACPGVEVIVRTGKTEDLIDMVKSNEVDLIFSLYQKIYGTEWICPAEAKEEIVFVTAADNPLADGQRTDIRTLVETPFILTEMGATYRYELEKYLAELELQIAPILEIGNTETIIHLLERGIGSSFLPLYTVRKKMGQGCLSQIHTTLPEIHMYNQLLYHKNKWVTPQMQIFIDMAQELIYANHI